MSFFGRLFGRDPQDLFLTYTPQESTWRVVSWNFDLKGAQERRWSVEAHGKKKNVILWNRDQLESVQFFENDRLIRRRRISKQVDHLKGLMNIAIHSTIKFSVEENHSFMLSPVVGATTMDFQNEARALQWIQASFGTLSRALEKIKTDPSLILTAAFFSGVEPQSSERVLRLLVLNLDIFFYLKADQSLQIVIFDDKNQGHGSSQSPTFQQIIKVTKPQIYDEMVRLAHQVATVGEIR